LSLADHLAARGPDLDPEQWRWHNGQVESILAGYLQQPGVIAPVKLLDGHDLIALFGLKPGPEIRDILESVREAQAAGEFFSREEALSYVKNRLLYREQK
jgi:poly(A) polymerase